MFMKTPLVMTTPQVMGIFYAHIMEHISQKARKMVMKELQDLIDIAMNKSSPEDVDKQVMQKHIMELQAKMQDPSQIEKLITMKMERVVDRGHATVNSSSK